MRFLFVCLLAFSLSPVIAAVDFFNVDSNTVALWRFNEGGGDSLHDASGNGHHGRFNKTPLWVSTAGVSGSGVNFDGTTYAKVENNGIFNLAGSWILEARVYLGSSYSTGYSRILGCHMYGANTTGYVWGAGGTLFEAYNNKGQMSANSSGALITSGVWYVIKIHYDSTAKLVRYYQNGNLTDSLVRNLDSIKYVPMPLLIGAELGSDSITATYNFVGTLDEIKISRIQPYRGPKPVLIANPSPTLDRKPYFRWHPLTGAASYTIQIDTLPGFITPFIVISTNDTFFQPLTNLSMRAIYWRVRSDLSPVFSATSSFIIQDPAIPVPIPYTPNPTQARRITLRWHKVAGASDYRILVSGDTGFTNINLSIPVVDTFFTALSDLPFGTNYWKVKSSLNAQYSATSSVLIQPDTIPFLYRFNGGTTIQRKPAFRWKPVQRAASYRIQIDTSASFVSPIMALDVPDTAFTPLVNLNFRSYFWRVSCSLNPSAFSPVDSVRVVPGLSGEMRMASGIDANLDIFPNPVNALATFRFSNPDRRATILVTSVNGKRMAEFQGLTENRLAWDTSKQPCGLYVVTLRLPGKTVSRRILLVK